MAEIIGAVAGGLTIAGLTKLCLDAFDVIRVARQQGLDAKKLSLRLNIERARLYIWAEQMGLTGPDAAEGAGRLRDSQFRPLVEEALGLIVQLFRDGGRLQRVYGCEVYDEHLDRNRSLENAAPDVVDRLAAPFSGFRIGKKVVDTKAFCESRTLWVIKDRRKFIDLVQEVRDMIDRLQDITQLVSTRARQEDVMRQNVEQIRDVDALSLVSGVCQTDYPYISDAASARTDASTSSTERRDIKHWISDVEDRQGLSERQDLENLTITELKELVRCNNAAKREAREAFHKHEIWLLKKNDHLNQRLDSLNARVEYEQSHSSDALLQMVKELQSANDGPQVPLSAEHKAHLTALQDAVFARTQALDEVQREHEELIIAVEEQQSQQRLFHQIRHALRSEAPGLPRERSGPLAKKGGV